MLELFNTYTRSEEEFTPLKGNEVRFYCCGPTVYNHAHIGNLRTYVFEDVLRRYLKYKGFKVKEAMNFTDVDDKTIRGARQEKKPLKEFTREYERNFIEDCEALHIEPPEVRCRATEHIPEMVDNVKRLLEKGYAYKTNDGIYYKISAFKDYGKLSHLDISSLKPGARVSVDEYEKEGVSDFALWKTWTQEDGGVYWETELGKGRPGWHIECSAMSTKYLGEYFDIHSGGVDLIFPHHENEISQSQPLTGKPLARFWLHSEHLLVDGQRMGKRFKNFYTLGDITQKGFSPLALRYFYISSHYRQQLNFTFEALKNSQKTLEKLQLFLEEARAKYSSGNPSVEIQEEKENAFAEIEKHMDADLNTPQALAALHSFVNKANKMQLAPADYGEVVAFLQRVDKIFGIFDWSEKKVDEQLKLKVEALLKQREELRRKKKFKQADEIRAKLAGMRVIVEDAAEGQKWRLA